MKPTVEIFHAEQRVGSWTILADAGTSPAPTSAAVHDVLSAFVAAFRDLVRPVDASVDRMWLTPDGHVAKVTEAQPTTVDAAGRLGLGADDTADPGRTMLLTAVHVDCAVRLPAGGGANGGATFYYGTVVDFDAEDRAVPLERRATVTMHVNEWRAAANRDALARALHSWEELAGQPITEWSSSIYPVNIARYGFDFAARDR
jgi:hypothetical protein